MRAIYLIARREYLSYVATWGFWLSLLSVPLFMVLGASIPFLVESSQPTRYYVVIDETGQGYDAIVQDGLERERRERARLALETLAQVRGEAERDRALAAFDEAPSMMEGLSQALDILGIDQSAAEFAAGFGNRVRVEAPAVDPSVLRPFLVGERSVNTPEGPRAVFGALYIREGEDRPLSLTWYSTNLTDDAIAADARRVLERHLRRQALAAQGLSEAEIDALAQLAPPIRNIDPSVEAAEEREVTSADRIPYFLAILLAFLLWTSVFSVANMLLTSLIEEKGGKIIELLLSTARFHEILVGKLAGVAAVSFTLFAVWGLVGTGVAVAGSGALVALDPDLAGLLAGIAQPGLFFAAFCYFVVGYLMFGSIFLALGSLCETLQDAQTLMTPIILVLMAPLLILSFSFQAMDSAFVEIASWVPLWTPFVMMARLPTDPPAWELLGTTALMLATMVFVLWGATAVFRQGALGSADVDTVKGWFGMGKKG
ncbi:ABC transporter permease [Marinicauda algicola]|uniref:ABC transporter permease n=1 Tax=Marinicauda algicola TaxID=2029849 RepID=A0A4S2H4Y7_9PROT|nr:ABC transporter permease [Marinicauda algicola]TGY90372.1 ABC transporter permease [Marinicauda algicola]